MAKDLNIGEPVLPRQRRPPARIDSGSEPHRFSSPLEYYRHLYYEACDLILKELDDRFEQKELLPQVLCLETVLMKAANGEDYDEELQSLEDS